MTITKEHETTVLTIREVAKRLKISEWLVQEQIRLKHLPVIRIGRRVLVSEIDLENFIARQRSLARGGSQHGL